MSVKSPAPLLRKHTTPFRYANSVRREGAKILPGAREWFPELQRRRAAARPVDKHGNVGASTYRNVIEDGVLK